MPTWVAVADLLSLCRQRGQFDKKLSAKKSQPPQAMTRDDDVVCKVEEKIGILFAFGSTATTILVVL